ncbi:M20 aminoacylase family protein [Marinomonas mediterranea]|uniref:M20 aminoacylase family protein n=1 Tax=Marinomonas mediterranea TaxID=119864 RepID=UPI00234AB813|nr:M20 aminoacylase family protein [Marinomonas mediterranea]WCN08271.1 amidohydrolase [Marinomonas mediterranea]
MQFNDLILEVTKWRKEIHQHPELAFEEHKTSQKVAALLREFQLDDVFEGIGETGVVGVLKNGKGPCIGLRADMDALPMKELGECSHKSQHDGCMHACGHDGHTAMLLGAAKYLAQYKPFNGTVYFIFQPAEEGAAGAQKMIDDGLFERFNMDAVYGLHNWPGLPAGNIAVNEGAIMASVDTFEITIEGKGCHAAMPHLGIDPIISASELVLDLQTIVSRRISPLESAVVSVTTFHSGDAFNVIPEVASLTGCVRCLAPETRVRVEELMHEYINGVNSANKGVKVTLVYRKGYPVTENHKEHAQIIYQNAKSLVGEEKVHFNLDPSMASEDFSFMLQERPGAYFWLGVDKKDEDVVSLHNPYYEFNDDVIETGVRFWCSLVERLVAPTCGS